MACKVQTQDWMSWNIRYDNPQDGPDRWEIRRQGLSGYIQTFNPAVIGLQEVLHHQLTYLNDSLSGYAYYGVGRDDGQNKGEFCPVFYNTKLFSLVQGQTFWLSKTPGIPSKDWDAALPRIATMVILKDIKSGDSIWVVNTHFDHVGEMARLHSAELIIEVLKPALDSGKKVVLMGDFNAEPSEAPITLLKQYFTETCPPNRILEGTFNGFDVQKTSFKRIDYIWLSRNNWQLTDYGVLQLKLNQRYVSDHFPVKISVR